MTSTVSVHLPEGAPPSGPADQKAPSRWLTIGRMAATIWSNPKAKIGVIILGVFVLTAIFAPLLAPTGAVRTASNATPTRAGPTGWAPRPPVRTF
jgi:peptide/nickel transport system permease protein